MPAFPGTRPSSGPASPQPTVPVPLEPGTPGWAATAQSVIPLRYLSYGQSPAAVQRFPPMFKGRPG